MASNDDGKGAADKGRAGSGKPRGETAEGRNGSGPASAARAAEDGGSRAEPQLVPAAAPMIGPAAQPRGLGPRRAQYMIATQPSFGRAAGSALGMTAGVTPFGLAPLSADLLVQGFSSTPGIEFVKRIDPPRELRPLGLNLFSAGGDAGTVLVARMDPERAELLQQEAGPRATVVRDLPLVFSLAPGPADLRFKNPGVVVPLSAGFSTTIQVTGGGQPLADAEVYVFGSVWPTQGVTDAQGRCVLSILGESPDTIQALYVKPKLDYWSFYLTQPSLVPGGVSAVEVKPLSQSLQQFPQQQLVGWGGIAMGLDQVPTNLNGAGIKIAIIDSGAAQKTHRNLRQMGPGKSVVGPTDDAWTDDTIGHGSHCAGVIAGGPVGPNGSGIRGFAPGAEVHICRIFPGGFFSDLVSAIDYCIEKGVDVINMSLGGGDFNPIVEERLVRAKQMGIACIVAAGNSGGPVQFPASTPHCLAVAAIGKWGEFPADSYHAQQAMGGEASGSGYFPASFSCFGPEIDVCAPGVAIVSSLPPDGFAAWDGTSMATPHVTGLAALVLAHHPDFAGAFHGKDARRVERLFQIIKESCVMLPVVGGVDRQGAGLPWAPKALGLQASTQPGAAQPAAVGGITIEAATLAALRQLLGMMGGQAGAPQPAAAGVSPMSAMGAMPTGGNPWEHTPVRGPAATGGPGNGAGAPDWLAALAQDATVADIEAYRQFLAQGGTPY